MNRLKKAVLAIGLGILAMSAQAAGELVSNGDFAIDNVKVPEDLDDPTYWGVTGNSSFTSNASPGSNGSASMFDSGDWIYQTVTLSSASSYTFSFMATGDSQVTGTFAFDEDNDKVSTWANQNWTTGDVTFSPGSNIFNLKTAGSIVDGDFTAKLYFGSPQGGILGIDNVSITTAVPEPESWAMLLVGLTAVGLARRRKAGQIAG